MLYLWSTTHFDIQEKLQNVGCDFRLMVHSHCPNQDWDRWNCVQNLMASATVSTSVSGSLQSVHLQTILYNPFFIGLGLSLGYCQCDYSIKTKLKKRSESMFECHLQTSCLEKNETHQLCVERSNIHICDKQLRYVSFFRIEDKIFQPVIVILKRTFRLITIRTWIQLNGTQSYL